jgi:hypothetical protein
MKTTNNSSTFGVNAAALGALTIAGITGYILTMKQSKHKEDFVDGLSQTFVVDQSIGSSAHTSTSDVGQYASQMQRASSVAEGLKMHKVEGTYQSQVAPRMSPLNNFGPMLRTQAKYNKASGAQNPMSLGLNPSKPLSSMGDYIDYNEGKQMEPYLPMEETYHNQPMEETYHNQNHQPPSQTLHKKMLAEKKASLDGMMGGSDDPKQPIVYERYIYANRNSRLRAYGDPIRGDLPIIPEPPGWFRPSAHPNIDLRQGAMNVMSGENESTRKLQDLIFKSSGKADYTIAGVNLADQTSGFATAGAGDIHLTNFP